MASPGDALLFAVSASRELPWSSFKAAVDATCAPDGRFANEMRYVRSEAASVGDALGHWEVVNAGGTKRVVIAPPALARLPWPGLPRAVLCGSRSPDTLDDLREACAKQPNIDVSAGIQSGHPYAPTRIELRATSEQALADAANATGVVWLPAPASWSLAVASCSLSDYIKTLEWVSRADLNWDRRDFDAERLAFGRAGDGEVAPALRLSAYSHPDGWAWRDWLWSGDTAADVDRDWGRYAILRNAGRRVLGYDGRDGHVTAPRQAPLPKLLARALALCSGQAPSLRESEGLGLHAYPGVPAGVFALVASKLGQDLST